MKTSLKFAIMKKSWKFAIIKKMISIWQHRSILIDSIFGHLFMKRSLPLLHWHKQYSSAIQAEVTELYARLERDSHPADDWDLPQCYDKLVSRSCVSLCDWQQVRAKANNEGWGSTSCITHQRHHHHIHHIHHIHHVDNSCTARNQSSLITVLNLNVDGDLEATPSVNFHQSCIYQLVDKSLLSNDGPVLLRPGHDFFWIHYPILNP